MDDAGEDDRTRGGSEAGARPTPGPSRDAFEEFGPADFAEMSRAEWEAAFDPETWITGARLLDRVADELRSRVADRTLFAVVERIHLDGEEAVLAYTDVSYAVVSPDGTVDGEGTLRGEVESTVALCAMPAYEPEVPPPGPLLPDPATVTSGSGDLGNRLLQAVAAVQFLAGLGLLLSPLVVSGTGRGTALLTTVVGLAFVGIAVVLFVLVANARLSDRFRAAEYRQRLAAAGVGRDGRPDFLPTDDENTEP